MSDARDELLVPDRRVVSIDEAKREREKPRSTGKMDDFVTRREFMQFTTKIGDGIGKASSMVGQQVYDQVADETSALLEEMHQRLWHQMLMELERRSFRGRCRALALRLGLIRVRAPALVDAVDALDPNVHAAQRAAALEELREQAEQAVASAIPSPPAEGGLDD